MTKPLLAIDKRFVRKVDLFRERSRLKDGRVFCELCHARLATDLHEILNRVHYPHEMIHEIPDVLLSCLCNDCNVNRADTLKARAQLLKANLKLYGFEEGWRSIEEFNRKLGNRDMNVDVKLKNL